VVDAGLVGGRIVSRVGLEGKPQVGRRPRRRRCRENASGMAPIRRCRRCSSTSWSCFHAGLLRTDCAGDCSGGSVSFFSVPPHRVACPWRASNPGTPVRRTVSHFLFDGCLVANALVHPVLPQRLTWLAFPGARYRPRPLPGRGRTPVGLCARRCGRGTEQQ